MIFSFVYQLVPQEAQNRAVQRSPATPKRRDRLEILHHHFTENDLAPASGTGS